MTLEKPSEIPNDWDIIVVSAEMTRILHRRLTDIIKRGKKHDQCVLFLTTRGGDPDGAFRIARCLKHNYKKLRINIPSFCKSAGTLLAIAADELVIGDLGELGPLDVQVEKRTEIGEQSSCLDIMRSIDSIISYAQGAFRECLLDTKLGGRISTKLAGEFAHQFSSRLFSPLIAQIDPQTLGEMNRAQQIALEYGRRLNEYTKNLKGENSLFRLIGGYPCHSFVIDRKEAKTLFRYVSIPEKWEDDFFQTFFDILIDESGFSSYYNGKEDSESAKSTEPVKQSEKHEPELNGEV